MGFNSGFCHLGGRDLRKNGYLGGGSSLGWRWELPYFVKLESEGVFIKPADDENAESSTERGNRSKEVKKRSRDLTTLPSGFLFLWYCFIFLFLLIIYIAAVLVYYWWPTTKTTKLYFKYLE